MKPGCPPMVWAGRFLLGMGKVIFAFFSPLLPLAMKNRLVILVGRAWREIHLYCAFFPRWTWRTSSGMGLLWNGHWALSVCLSVWMGRSMWGKCQPFLIDGNMRMNWPINLGLGREIEYGQFKDSLLDDSLHETFEIRKKILKINLIDFNPSTHSDNRSPEFPHWNMFFCHFSYQNTYISVFVYSNQTWCRM